MQRLARVLTSRHSSEQISLSQRSAGKNTTRTTATTTRMVRTWPHLTRTIFGLSACPFRAARLHIALRCCGALGKCCLGVARHDAFHGPLTLRKLTLVLPRSYNAVFLQMDAISLFHTSLSPHFPAASVRIFRVCSLLTLLCFPSSDGIATPLLQATTPTSWRQRPFH